jgi:hypothetical protein
MTTRKQQLPEEATVEPRVLTPEEDAERALRAVEISAAEELEGEDPLSVADPDSPVRMPGELSTRPRESGDEGVGTSRPPARPPASARR